MKIQTNNNLQRVKNLFKPIFGFLIFVLLILLACNPWHEQEKEKAVTIDFSTPDTSPHRHNLQIQSPEPLKVAVSAIISPKETFSYYEELFDYISKKTGQNIEFKQRKTYREVNKMLERDEVDVAFICSGAYTIGRQEASIEILAVPVCQGKPLYQAYVITHKSSGIESFQDLRDKNFAFTDPMSNTGKLYAVKRVGELGSTPEEYFSKVIYSFGHDISMQLVMKKVVDGATIDGLVYEYIKKKSPEKVESLNIIEKSEYYGIPPIVTSNAIDPLIKKQLKEVFLNFHKDTIGQKILEKLLIDKFIEGDDASYNTIREMQKKTSR